LPFKVSQQHNSPEVRISNTVDAGETKMKKLALGLILAALSSGVFAQGAEVAGTTNVVAGGSAAGAGEALGAGTVVTTNAVLVTAGVVVAGVVSAGTKTETTTSHSCASQTKSCLAFCFQRAGLFARRRASRLFHFPG
jgi:hypothetical protein